MPNNSVSDAITYTEISKPNEISALTHNENQLKISNQFNLEQPAQINNINKTIEQHNHTENKNEHINFPNWYISVSFGKSSSSNYMKAVTLAQQALNTIRKQIMVLFYIKQYILADLMNTLLLSAYMNLLQIGNHLLL